MNLTDSVYMTPDGPVRLGDATKEQLIQWLCDAYEGQRILLEQHIAEMDLLS